MSWRLAVFTSLLILSVPSLSSAAPKEDVASATQAWIDAMNSHDPARVVALYDPEAVLWGTQSPTLRDSPATIRDYFNVLSTVPQPSSRSPWRNASVREDGPEAIDRYPRWYAFPAGCASAASVAARKAREMISAARRIIMPPPTCAG
jgi:hypothetical protein